MQLTDVPLTFFVDQGGAEDIKNYTATIDWGDCSASDTGTVEPVFDSLFLVRGNHKYTTPGTFTVLVTIEDEGGYRITCSTTGIISAGSPPPGSRSGAPPASPVAKPAHDSYDLAASPHEQACEATPSQLAAAVFSDSDYQEQMRTRSAATLPLARLPFFMHDRVAAVRW